MTGQQKMGTISFETKWCKNKSDGHMLKMFLQILISFFKNRSDLFVRLSWSLGKKLTWKPFAENAKI